MKISIQDSPALILIDIQKGFNDINYWGGQRNNPDAEVNAGKILRLWRKYNLPLFHIKHCSTDPNSKLAEGNEGNEFQDVIKPLSHEIVIKKSVNSAFIGTDLKEQLEWLDSKKLVIVGLTTDHCVSTTTRMAGNFGFDTYVVNDATATFSKRGFDGKVYSAETMHDTAIACLMNEFATIVTTSYLQNNLPV